jgi:hypothetical protein
MPSSSAQTLAIAARDDRVARGHDDVAVLGNVHLSTRFAAGVEPEARGDAAALILAERCLVVLRVLRSFDRLEIADARIDRAVRRLGALLGAVNPPELERVDLQRLGELVEHALDGMCADRCARCAIGSDLGPVRADVVADRKHVRDVIGREAAARGAADRRAGECAGLQIERALRGDDLAVLGGADLHGALRAGGRPGRPHHLFAGHHHLHRTAGFFGEECRQRLEVNDGLAAKAAADLGGDGADVTLLDAGQERRHGAYHELALAGAPDRRLVVGGDADEAGVRLDIALVHRARRE